MGVYCILKQHTVLYVHWVIISRRWEWNQKRDSGWPINTDSPRKKKVLRTTGQTAKSQAPKKPRNDTILPEHLLAHTRITYVYSHYYIWSFCHHFPCKNDVLITSTRIKFSNHENIAYTNFLSIASCRIINVRYRNDLLVTEIRVANLAVRVSIVNSAVRVRFSSENYGILKDCWMKLLDSCV